MDIEMPRLNGLDALKLIMKDTPIPVIMVSSLTEEGPGRQLKHWRLGRLTMCPSTCQ